MRPPAAPRYRARARLGGHPRRRDARRREPRAGHRGRAPRADRRGGCARARAEQDCVDSVITLLAVGLGGDVPKTPETRGRAWHTCHSAGSSTTTRPSAMLSRNTSHSCTRRRSSHPFCSTEIWKGDVGICIGHQKSESACFNKAWVLLFSNLLNPESKSCRRFLLFARAEHMGCDLHDLKSASLHRNL